MPLIKGYPEGSNISILDARYRYSQKSEDGKYSPDRMNILYIDNETGRKGHEVITKPEYEYYIAKDDVPLSHNLFFIEKEKVDKIVVPFNDLLKDIAQRNGKSNFYYDNISNGNRRANNELHTLYNVFNSDMNIEDHYRFRFDKMYKNPPIMPLKKAYFDIEVDTISMMSDFPELGECPINAVSYIYSNKVTVFLLRNPENPLIDEFEQSINKDLFNELNDFIIENVGGMDQATKFGVANLEYEFVFYDDEIKLIQDLFALINVNEPDFLLAWNMAFDIPYIIERLKGLGIDPAEIMSHPSFNKSEKFADYFIDERHQNEYEARGDRYDISSHTVFLDQLIHFASRRKGQAKFPNFKLDTAGSIIAKVRKLDYSHITTKLSDLPYLDYKTFVFYNIMDTIVQKCIEEKVKDIDYIYTKCLTNNTRYDKGHRQTVYLTNRATKDFYEEGFIIGNNTNRHAIKTVFEGALVGNPVNNSDYSKARMYNQILNIARNLLDFDYKSLYPSCALQDNMSPNTIIARIEIPEKVYEYENPFNHYMEGADDIDNRIYLRSGNYIEDLISENVIEFCHRWMHYASFMEWTDDLRYYFTDIEHPVMVMNPYKMFDHVSPNAAKPRVFSKADEGPRRMFIRQVKPLDYGSYLNKIGGIK